MRGFLGKLVEVAYNFLLSFPQKHWIGVIFLNWSDRVCVFKISVMVESTFSVFRLRLPWSLGEGRRSIEGPHVLEIIWFIALSDWFLSGSSTLLCFQSCVFIT